MDAEIASEFQNLIFRKTVKTPRRFFRGVGTGRDTPKPIRLGRLCKTLLVQATVVEPGIPQL